VNHLHGELQPFGLEVVAFVDEHGAVLGGWDLAAVHGGDEFGDELVRVVAGCIP
jgi:hypothetical protein